MGGGCCGKFENKLGRLFELYGAFASRHPWKILIVAIAINIGLGVGLFYINMETDVVVLYTPSNSDALADRRQLKDLYVDRSGTNFQIKMLHDFGLYGEILVRTKNDSNILRNETLDEIRRIDSFIRNIQVTDKSGNILSYNSLCARNYAGCVVFGDVVLSDGFREAKKECGIPWPEFMNTSLTSILGNVYHTGGRLYSATAVKLRYFLRHETPQMKNVSQKWEDKFIDKIGKLNTNLTEIAYTYSDAVNTEIQASTSGAAEIFSITFLLMSTYASLATIATGRGINCVADRQNLGKAGVFPAILAIAAAVGMLSFCGLKFVNTVGVMPFLIIGIGIDDMFLLLSGLADTLGNSEYNTIEKRISQTLKITGVSITITSLTDSLAFAVGATSEFYSVRNFCIFTGVAVMFCYINQLIIFVPCMVLNEKRVEQNKHQFTCVPVKSRSEAEEEGRSRSYILCCTGSKPNDRKTVENFLEIYPKKFLKNILGFTGVKIIIIAAFIGYIVASIYGVVNLEQGLKLYDLTTKESYFYKYNLWNEDYFTNEFLISFTVTSPESYYKKSTKNKIDNLLKRAQEDPAVNDDFKINWLDTYDAFNGRQFLSERTFLQNFRTFTSIRPDLETDVLFDSKNSSILSSRYYVLSESIKSTTEQGDLMLRLRDIAKDSELDCFVYNPLFVYYEQFVRILGNTLQTVGITIIVMFIITSIFMPNFGMVMLVTLTLFSSVLGVFGFMHHWDLTLSSITMIDLIMCVGFSVDCSVHICHAFLHARGSTGDEKMFNSIELSGGPILNACVSSIIGILLLLANSSYIYQSFFKLMFLVIVFGLGHAVLLLPVLLSLVCKRKPKPEKTGKIVPIQNGGAKVNLAYTISSHECHYFSVYVMKNDDWFLYAATSTQYFDYDVSFLHNYIIKPNRLGLDTPILMEVKDNAMYYKYLNTDEVNYYNMFLRDMTNSYTNVNYTKFLKRVEFENTNKTLSFPSHQKYIIGLKSFSEGDTSWDNVLCSINME